MRVATLEAYSTAYDALKGRYPVLWGNIFLDAAKLDKIFKSKECLLEETENSLFLLIPRHEFYDLLFLTGDCQHFPEALEIWLAAWPKDRPIRASVIGREPDSGDLAAQFEKSGFVLIKKLMRTKLKPPKEKILAAMRPFAEEARDLLGYARHGDEEEILEILQDAFDPMGDNLPEIQEISERIDEKGIAVIRKDGRILSLNYFAVHSGVFHGIYDVTRKEHRGGNGYFMALASFVHDDLDARGIRCAQSFGWRDVTKKKLVKHAEKSDQAADGIMVYYLRWPAADEVQA